MQPSLNLNFRSGSTIDPRVTFTRSDTAAVATYVNHEGFIKTAAMGQPRFTHDPVSKRRLGLLMEESRTNSYLYSEDFSNAAWLKWRSLITAAPSIVAPDGSTNTWKMAVDTISPGTSRFISQNITTSVGVWYAFSFYVKAAEKSWAYMEFSAAAFGVAQGVYFDLTNGVVGSKGADIYADIFPHGNGWYRICASIQAKATVTSGTSVVMCMADGNGDIVIAESNGTSGIYVWGAQFEQENVGGTSFGSGTALAGTSNTIQLAGTSSSSGTLNVCWVYISAGTGAGQLRQANAYDTVNKIVTVSSNWTVIPDATSQYQLFRHSYLNTSTTYVKTTSAAVTRQTESLLSSNPSEWYNKNEGTFVITVNNKGSCYYATVNTHIAYLIYAYGGSSNDVLQGFNYPESVRGYFGWDYVAGGVSYTSQDDSLGSNPQNTVDCWGCSYSVAQNVSSRNGKNISVTDVGGATFMPNAVYFAGINVPRYQPNSYIADIKYYPFNVNQSQLNAMTRLQDKDHTTMSLNMASEKIDNAFTFTRPDATTCATYFGDDGLLKTAPANTPRFEYDPITGEFRGLLMERSSTNYFRNDFPTIAGGALSTGTAIAPDGTTAKKFVLTAGATNFPSVGYESFTIALTSGQTTHVSLSGWFKNFGASDYRPLLVLDANVTGASQNYATVSLNAANGTTSGKSYGSCWTEYEAPKVTLHPNGMYRVTWSLTFTQDATIRNRIAGYVQVRDSVGSGTFTADGTSGIQLFGMQLENLYTATSYIVTTSAAVTRANELLIQSVGAVSDWYNDDEGTWIVEGSSYAIPPSANTWPRLLSMKDSSNADRFDYYLNTLSGSVNVFTTDTNGATSAFSDQVSIPLDDIPFKTSVTYTRGGNGVLMRDGAYVDRTITFSELVTNPNQFTVGGYATATEQLMGHIRNITYFPYKVSDTTAQQASDFQVTSGVNKPTLSLNLAMSKKLDQRFTFTRVDATACATYFDYNGILRTALPGVPRFTHDPITHESLGLMCEESSTNRALSSNNLANATYWTIVNNITATANAAVAPNGLTEATKLTISGAYSDPYYGQLWNTGSALANRTFTFSVWLWTDAGQSMTNHNIYLYDQSVGEVGASTITITSIPTRYTVTKTFGGAEADTSLVIRIDNDQAGSGLGGYLYAWGAQLEEKPDATSFIPTTTAAVTRAADLCSYATSGWYNPLEGTILVEGRFFKTTPTGGTAGNVVYFDSGVDTNQVAIRHVDTSLLDFYVLNTSSAVVDMTGFTVGKNTEFVAVAGFKTNDYAFNVGNQPIQIDTSGALPTMTTLYLGSRRAQNQYMNGTIAKFAYYPKRLTNQQITQLSG